MADAIRPGVNIERVRENQISQAAAHRGDAGRAGKKEHADKTPTDEGPAKVLKYEELAEGRTKMLMSDGRTVTKAANGVLREEDEDGSVRISLPNGILISQDAEGNATGFDPESGKRLNVEAYQKNDNGQFYYEFKDKAGRKYLATSETLRFEVTNRSGTVHQKVASTGSMHIAATTVVRDPDSGQFHSDTENFWVEADGKVHNKGKHMRHAHIDNNSLSYVQHGDIRLDMDLPYEIPFEIHGPTVRAMPAETPAFEQRPAGDPPSPGLRGPQAKQAAAWAEAPVAEEPVADVPRQQTPAQDQPPVDGPLTAAPQPPPAVQPQPPQAAIPQVGMPQPPPTGMPPAGMPPAGMPPAGMPPVGMPPGGMPPAGMPPVGMPPGGMPPGGMPPGGMPPGGMPPAGMPPGGMPPGVPGMQPQFMMTPGIPGSPIPGAGFQAPFAGGAPDQPWGMPAFQMPNAPPMALPADPFQTVQTANGIMRQAQPDGSMWTSLPNGVVFVKYPDGDTAVYDARSPQPLPAVVGDVVTPNGGPEKQIQFRDAAGNEYLMYSKSLDFVVTSPDRSVRQVVMPQGNILVLAQTPGVDDKGQPTVQQHMAEIFPNGQVNTFGERGLQVGGDRIILQGPNGQAGMLPLPYPVPNFQGYQQTLRAVNPQAFPTATSGNFTTPGLTPPPPVPPQGGPQPGAPPPPPVMTPQPPLATPQPAPPAPQPPAQPAPQPPAQPAPQPPAPPAPAPAGLSEEQAAALQGIMTQMQSFNASPAVLSELQPLLAKVLTNTATPEESARADALITQGMNGAAAAAQAQASETPVQNQPAAPPQAAPQAEPPAAPAQPAAPPQAAPQAEAPAAPAQPAAAALNDDQKVAVDQIMAQVAGNAPESLRSELRPLLEKVIAQTASPDEMARVDLLVQQGLAASAGASPEAPGSARPQEAPQSAAPAPAAEPQNAAPAADQPAVALNDQQRAAVDQMLAQVASYQPSDAVMTELKPLLERVAGQVASQEEIQRADALIKGAIAAGQKAASPPSVGNPDVPFGTPHLATSEELLAAALGRPEYAYAANPPKEYFQALQRAQAQPQAPAAEIPAPPQVPAQPAPVAGNGADVLNAPPPVPQPAAAAAQGGGPVLINPAMAGAPPPAHAMAAAPPPVMTNPAITGVTPPVPPPAPPPPAGARPAPTVGAVDPQAPGATPPPASSAAGPHKPGVWQRIKNFFSGGDAPSSVQQNSWANRYGMGCNPYPSHCYTPNSYAPYQSMQSMMATTMLMTTLSSMMFMPSMYYWSPFSMCGAGMMGMGLGMTMGMGMGMWGGGWGGWGW